MTKFKKLLRIVLEDRETEELKIPDIWRENLPAVYRSDLKGSVYKAIELVEELNKDKWYTPSGKSLLLYRGISHRNEPWVVKDIRKDREPRDTKEWVDELVERVRSKYYSFVPSRRASKFAASSKEGRLEVSDKYGHPHIVFPEKDAPIYSINRDPMHFMNSIRESGRKVESMMKSSKRNSLTEEGTKIRKKLKEKVKEFDPNIWKFAREIVSGDLDFDVTKHPDKLARSADDAYEHFHKKKFTLPEGTEKTLVRIFADLCGNISEIFEDISAYFANLSEGVVAESGEVMYSGDSYLRVEWRFWKFFIEYDFSEDKARLHQLVRSVADENSDQLQLNI